ncbi:indole-3-glycerol phosphate synthase-domain-containing protein [Zopfochytrium polystomum]|nr:indole-3-glycerol phosphate synthase-domain-containing protein [Zopfochytrium polystomum]
MAPPTREDVTLLIDNYDSFTWNVYQYLSDLGANVLVYRNDELTLQECLDMNPRNVVISPGPGHPRDAGISMEVIRAFAGKVPILGVCLGEQCMFELYGGTVTYAGEIVHGKTSPVTHDGKGLYEGVSQGIECTRYHSLAGDKRTLPACLEITSTTESGLVMGVRHREYVMEGVQYHPESIASEEGKKIFLNFLKWDGGTWANLKIRPEFANAAAALRGDQASASSTSALIPTTGISVKDLVKINSTSRNTAKSSSDSKAPSILETIQAKRKLDVAAARSIPGASEAELIRSLALGLAPKVIDFRQRLLNQSANAGQVAVLAEIKRASPSKGPIDMGAHAPSQALEYALGGAAAISVLTEPHWFKGSLADLRQVRAALETVPSRPAVLLKDFVVDQYQIYEARLAGADTVLLIVAILNDKELSTLLATARALGMEPLVEVANEEEMKRAVKAGSKVIGVNNRDLHTFTVDMSRTSNLSGLVPQDTVLCALSGIKDRSDVEKYIAAGAKGVLVGEHLMKSPNKRTFIQSLMGLNAPEPEDAEMDDPSPKLLVKVCGLTRPEDAVVAAEAGADFLGLIFAESPRKLTPQRAREIVEAVCSKLGKDAPGPRLTAAHRPRDGSYQSEEDRVRKLRSKLGRPLFVGVFSNENYETVNAVASLVGLDLVQFHGNEDPRLHSPLVRVPVVKAFHILGGDTGESVADRIALGSGYLSAVLLDTGVKGLAQQGGSGTTFDWNLAAAVVQRGTPIWVAGGLTPENVQQAVAQVRPWCVDVSSGVETDQKGVKDAAKVRSFVKAAKSEF